MTQMIQPLGREVVEALMGHKQFLDAPYLRYTEDQMRDFYLKGMSEVTILLHQQTVSEQAITSGFNKQYLMLAGFTEEELSKLGDLSNYTAEKIKGLISEKTKQHLGINGN